MDPEIQKLERVRKGLSEEERDRFDTYYAQRRKNPAIAQIMSTAGTTGMDTFYLDKRGVGLLKLFTLGGLFIWSFFDLFTATSRAHKRNQEIIEEVRSAIVEARTPSR